MVTGRQTSILRSVLKLGRPNVNEIVRPGGQSPTRLKLNLEELVRKGFLRMDREGTRHCHYFTITEKGLREVVKHDADAATSTVQAFADLMNAVTGLTAHPSFPTRENWTHHVHTFPVRVTRGKIRLNAKERNALFGHPYLLVKDKVFDLVKISHELVLKLEGKGEGSDAYISTHGGGINILPFEDVKDRFTHQTGKPTTPQTR